MSVLRFPEWQRPCELAFLEPDPEKLFQRVIVAETAIFRRIHGLTNTPENIELQAMDEALKHLQRLITNTFVLPISEDGIVNRPPRIPNKRLSPNRAERRTQPFA